jgi:hypothetical protein
LHPPPIEGKYILFKIVWNSKALFDEEDWISSTVFCFKKLEFHERVEDFQYYTNKELEFSN